MTAMLKKRWSNSIKFPQCGLLKTKSHQQASFKMSMSHFSQAFKMLRKGTWDCCLLENSDKIVCSLQQNSWSRCLKAVWQTRVPRKSKRNLCKSPKWCQQEWEYAKTRSFISRKNIFANELYVLDNFLAFQCIKIKQKWQHCAPRRQKI